MAFIRTRETPHGPRYDVRYRANGREWSKTFRSYDGAKAYRKKVEHRNSPVSLLTRRAVSDCSATTPMPGSSTGW